MQVNGRVIFDNNDGLSAQIERRSFTHADGTKRSLPLSILVANITIAPTAKLDFILGGQIPRFGAALGEFLRPISDKPESEEMYVSIDAPSDAWKALVIAAIVGVVGALAVDEGQQKFRYIKVLKKEDRKDGEPMEGRLAEFYPVDPSETAQ